MAIEKYEPRVSVEDVVVVDDQEKNGLISIMSSFLINVTERQFQYQHFYKE